MDLQTPQVPGIEFVFAGIQEKQSPPTSGKRKKTPSVVDEILSIPTSPRKISLKLEEEKSSSSDDDSLESLKGTTIAIGPRLSQLQEIVTTLDMKNTEDHLQIFQHIEKVNADRKLNTEFNRQTREDIGSIKTKIDNIEKLYKILNDGLSAAQEHETLRNQKESKTAQEELAKVLQKINTNADILTSVQQQYNELKTKYDEFKIQFDELCTTLAQNQTASTLLNKIISPPRLNSEKMGEGAIGEASQTSETTLEDMLTQQQKELLEVRKLIQLIQQLIQQLHVTSTKNQSDFHNVIDALRAKIAAAEQKAVAAQNKAVAVESRNETIIRRAFFFTTGTFAVLASFWIWWQTHKV